MAEPVYTFDRQSMRRISAAVQNSEGVKDRKGNKWYPVKGCGGGGGSAIMVGKTTAAWLKGNGQMIQPLEAVNENPVGEPVSVLNLFANVAAGKWVAFSRMGDGQAILLSAECD